MSRVSSVGFQSGVESRKRRPGLFFRQLIQNRFVLASILIVICTSPLVFATLGPKAAMVIAAAIIAPAILWTIRIWEFEKLVFTLMLVLSNVFIIHKAIAIHLANGDNLFGIREVSLGAVIGVGLWRGRDQLAYFARQPVILPGLLTIALLPSAALFGFIYGGSPLIIARETFTFSMWILPLVIASNIRTTKEVNQYTKYFVTFGMIVAVGSALEIASLGSFHIVSTYQQKFFGIMIRNFPDGWVMMEGAWVFGFVAFLLRDRVAAWSGVVVLMTISSLFTQIRVMPLAFVCTAIVVALLGMFGKARDRIARRSLIAVVSCLGMILGALLIVSVVYPELKELAVDRYSSLGDDSSGRLYELSRVASVVQKHPLTGTGLGVRYREDLPLLGDDEEANRLFAADTGTLVHNIFGYYLVKFGIPGILLFIRFVIAALVSLVRFAIRTCDANTKLAGLGLSAPVFSMIVIAQSGNVFGDIRQLPVAGIAVGILAAHIRLTQVKTPTLADR